MSPEKAPLILTLQMDNESQGFFNAARQRYFPSERNLLDAHLTLFHQLPDEPATYKCLTELNQEVFKMQITGLMNLGAGVAFRVESPQLQELHRQLGEMFSEALIPQDLQTLRPHVTIMNKSTPEKARQLMDELTPTFGEFKVEAIGLSLWRYLGGPWEHLNDFLFKTAAG